MTKYGSDQVGFLLVDGYSLLGVATDLQDDQEAGSEESHGFGDDWVEVLSTGVNKASLEQSGYFDDAANGVNAALVEGNGLQRIVNYGVSGNVIGRKVVCLAGAMQANYQRIMSRGALHKAAASYVVSGAVQEGAILEAHGSEAGDGDTEATPVDSYAPSLGGVNLVSNNGFETDASGWSAYGVATLTRVTTQQYTGLASLRVVTGNIATNEGAVYSVTGYTASESLIVGAWIKRTEAILSINMVARIHSVAGGWTTVTASSALSTDWQYVALDTGALPADVDDVQIVFLCTAQTEVTWYVDDVSAQRTNGAVFYLQVSALNLDGLAGVVITVLDSANGVDFLTLDTFTTVTAAPAKERIVTTGTIRRYLAVDWAFTGLVAESPTIELMVAGVRT